MANNAPEAEFKEGAAKVTVWSNERETHDGEKFNSVTATVSRLYPDESAEGGWSETNSNYSLRDLQNLQLIIGDAIDKIREIRG